MSATLYGTLVAAIAKEYEVQTSALHANSTLINRFGDAMKDFGLTADVKVQLGAKLSLIALAHRGQNAAPILAALKERGYRMDEPVKPRLQFNDGYTIWHVNVTGHSLEFGLLFYTEVEVS